MREIKFRAWWRGEMYDAVLLDFRKGSKGVGMGYIDNPSWGVRWPDSEELILMQYTGLKDKNGREIYEGDIVQYDDSIASIEWNDERARFILHWQDSHDHLGHKTFDRVDFLVSYKIIGNIYENPELLKEE